MTLDVVAAAVASMVLGFLWYGPVFGKTWMKLSGMKMGGAKQSSMAGPMALQFLGALVLAYVLNMFLSYAGATTEVAAATVGAWAWLGFVATVTLGGFLWEKKPFNLYLLNNAHNLVNFVLIAVVLVLV